MSHADPTNEAQTGAAPGPSPGESAPGVALRELLSSLASQLNQLGDIQRDLDEHATLIDERQRNVQAAEERMAQEQSRVAALQTELEAEQQTVAAEREALGEERSRVDDEGADLERQRDAIASERADLVSSAAAEEAWPKKEHAANEGLENVGEIEHEREATRADATYLEEKLRATESELESTCRQRDAAIAREDDDGARIKELEARIEEMESRPAEPAPVASAEVSSAPGADMRVRAMQQRIAKLEAQLAEGADASAPAAHDQAQVDDLRAKAERVAQVARHLHLRHRRLRQVRRLLRGRKPGPATGPAAPTGVRSSQDLDRHYARVRKIEQQHLLLKDRSASLAERERRMSRRWAHNRAIVVAGWLVAMAAASAGIGWLLTDHYLPAVVSASVRFEANARGTGALPDEDAREWGQWHTAILSDETFLGRLAKRMDERRMQAYASVPALRERLASDLTVDAAEPEVLTLVLAGTRPQEVTAVLDILATTLELESSRLRRKRTQRSWAELKGRHTVDGIPRYSRLSPATITDDRLYFAPPIAGGVFLVMLILVVVIYRRLARVKREFDDDGDLFNEAVHTLGSVSV